MIEVTRLNGTVYYINPDMLMFIEATPDTVITLTNGEKLMIKETPAQLQAQFVAFKQRIYTKGPDIGP